MPATITTAKAALILLALLCAVLQWKGLRSHLSYQDYHQLAEDAGNGRMEQDDAVWLTDLLKGPDASGSAPPQVSRSLALLHMYHVDLIAAAKRISPFQASQDPGLKNARLNAMTHLKAALSRTPSDGDLWLRLALLTRAENSAKPELKHYLHMSRKTAPYEGWVMMRRSTVAP